jgi:hypothetical protein
MTTSIQMTAEQEFLAKGYSPNGDFVKMTLTNARIKELMQNGYHFYSIYPID